MSPDRKKTINGVTVTEYYWAGEMVVYIDNRASGMSFDGAVKMLEDRAAALAKVTAA
jgi:hypothetical protein